MKPSFNFSGRCPFFPNGGDNEQTNDTQPNIKVSWFEEQVDTIITHRVVSNYEVYNYKQDASPESTAENGNPTDEILHLESQKQCSPDNEQSKHDTVTQLLEKLLIFNLNKLIDGKSSRDEDLGPCEVAAGLNNTTNNVKDKDDQKKGSKSFYKRIEESPEISGDVEPLNSLENLIMNSMGDYLSKFKQEINKAIDNKLESLKTFSPSTTSFSAGDGVSKLFTGTEENLGYSLKYSCLESTDLEDQSKESISPERSNLCVSAKDKEYHQFNVIRPEVQNMYLGKVANFESELINVIKKNQSNSSLKEELNNGLNPNKGNHDEPINLTKSCHETPLTNDKIKSDGDKDRDDLNPLRAGDSMVTESDDLSESCVAKAIKKNTNPKLIMDMAKFMYIIYESFRRFKEDNISEKSRCSESESVKSLCDSKAKNESAFPKDESSKLTVNLNKESGCSESESVNSLCDSKAKNESAFPTDESLTFNCNQTNKELDNNLPLKAASPDVQHYSEPKYEPYAATTGSEAAVLDFNFSNKCCREECPIISMACNIMDNEGTSFTFMPNFEKTKPSSLPEINEDCGYTIQKFKKNNIGYKPTKNNKVLDNLKELYLNNIEQKMVSSVECGDKYKCQIKKKFSPGRSRIGTIHDSKFYCNIRSKTSVKIKPTKNKSETNVRIKSKIRSKGSSSIISVNNLIKSRNRSNFKSVWKKKVISLDSIAISLLDNDVINRGSWLRKASPLSSFSTQEEQHIEEKVNFLKRLYLITFTGGKGQMNLTQMIDQHLTNIYNAICLDYVTDDVYNSVLYVSHQLRTSSQKNRDEIMSRWVKICNKLLDKDKKSFNLWSLHQLWVQFRTKICHLTTSPPIVPPNFILALTYPSEENRHIKEQVIRKYARDILEYISDPKLYNT